MSQYPSSPPLPPPPPIQTLNAIRMTYMNLFNQILDNSINIDCICKTTIKGDNENICEKENVTRGFDVNSDFMDDSEDDVDNDVIMNEPIESQNENLLSNLDIVPNESLLHLDVHDSRYKFSNRRVCDLSCFENLRFVYWSLKNCFNEDESQFRAKFGLKWEKFKFLRKDPKSCDYYGTTIFHYAASNNNYELLNYALEKYPDGVLCVDSKGMTPLMRAAQRNNYKCVEFLLSETYSDKNGSLSSTYTPLWFAVSNGYSELVKLFLNYNTSPSIVVKTNDPLISNNPDEIYEAPISASSYLFSPLRASIVYFKFNIMIDLLEYNSDVYELFHSTYINTQRRSLSEATLRFINEEYLNALKFFYRQFGPGENEKHLKYLFILNDFVDNQNVFRRMILELVKNVYEKIKQSSDLTRRVEHFLRSIHKGSIEDIIRDTVFVESYGYYLNWSKFIEIAEDFMSCMDLFIESDQVADFFQNLKPKYHKSLFEFANFLMANFFKPKSLKELCRFKIRKEIFSKATDSNNSYGKNFTKMDNVEKMLKKCGLPKNLICFILHRET